MTDPPMRSGGWDVTGWGINVRAVVAAVVAAILLTAGGMRGLEALVTHEIEQQLQPMERSLTEMKANQKELLRAVQAIREDMARQQALSRTERGGL